MLDVVCDSKRVKKIDNQHNQSIQCSLSIESPAETMVANNIKAGKLFSLRKMSCVYRAVKHGIGPLIK